MDKEFTASSGAKVKIGVSSWEDTNTFFMLALREIAKAGVSLKGLSKDMDASPLISAFLMAITSPEVYAAIWPCLEKTTYNGHKVSRGTFEDEKARQDYFEILKGFVIVNITPFLPKTALKYLEDAMKTITDTQKPT